MEEYYDSDNSIDNEEEGGEWITEDNLYKHMTHADTESLLTPEMKEGEEVSEEKPQVTGEATETKETEDKVVEKV
jgi:hypothetical protein